ncbi:MAG: ABC transporter ATP-binding protein [Verrucomicrobia bacterium]|nr:ABC transporter ATP-binding protein [Verrucomicrobiota bacterium]
MRLLLRQIVKTYGENRVLDGIDLVVEDRELFFLLGPSGCGKTTLLRVIAGFCEPDAGEVFFGSKRVNEIPPRRRNTGMVFQNYALWPHMTVAENVAYGLEVRKMDRKRRAEMTQEALRMVRMESCADRKPGQLSGGQQQRVALARALVIRPDILLLDEPLSNLDAALRLAMREEIRRIHEEAGVTTIYVTHDQEEALSMADRIGVMKAGRVLQTDAPRELYRRPRDRFVADFMGECNWFEGETAGADDRGLRVRTAAGDFCLPPRDGFQPGIAVWLGFRPEAVRFESGDENVLTAETIRSVYLGRLQEYTLRLPSGERIKAVEFNPREDRKRGSKTAVRVAPEDLLLLPRAG